LQVPAPFEYERATSVDEALELLTQLIDIDPLADELGYVSEHDGEVRIGAMTRHRALLESQLLARRLAVFTDAERVIAGPVVRNRGTIGGALCQADPSEDLSAVCAAIGAKMVVRGIDGDRVLSMREFHRGPYKTAVGPAEMLVEIRVQLREASGSAYEKVDRRVGDWAVAAAGASLTLSDGIISSAGIALAAVGSEVTSRQAEETLAGQAPSDELFERAAAVAAATCRPVSDQRGSTEYKRHVAGVLTERALLRAATRALPERAPVQKRTQEV
jgi:aerobic carbon-monoxide dehydrogenase medium subunit